MSKYFEPYGGDIWPKYINKSSDIHTIQSILAGSFNQLINDIFGNFSLSSEEDAFLLTPAENIVDQSNKVGSSWKNISDDFHRQTITIEKSSISSAKFKLKNEGAQSVTVTAELRQLPFEDSDGEVYATATALISANSNTTYSFDFDAHHLPIGELHVVIRRNESDNDDVFIQYDSAGTYSNTLSTSVDDFEYDEVGGDLWFETEYGNSRTFDIVDGIAVINANKTINTDTHVTIGAASSYGDRIDIVAMNEFGYLEVIEGIVSNKPISPDAELGDYFLKIAQIKVYKNKSTAAEMKINQDDSAGVFRTRSYLERMRRAEKFINYMHKYENPKRAKWDVEYPFMDVGASRNIAYDSESGSYKLSDITSMGATWDFKSDDNLNLNQTKNVARNHSAGTITLDQTQILAMSAWLQRQTPGVEYGTLGEHETHSQPVKYGTNIFSNIYGNGSKQSTYPAVNFYAEKAGYLVEFNNDEHIFTNVKDVRCYIFDANGNLFEESSRIQIAGRTEIRRSGSWVMQWLTDSTQAAQVNGINTNKWGCYFPFSGTKWLTPGWYTAIFVPTPINKNAVCKMHTQVWWDEAMGYGMNYKGLSSFSEYNSSYPFNPTRKSKVRNYWWMQHGCVIKKAKYVLAGVVQSSAVTTKDNFTQIDTVDIDVNIDLPTGTRYDLEVSNDGGNAFYNITGQTYFKFPSPGHAFVWRIKLYTSDENVTPVLKYLDTEGYAIKADLGLTHGDVLRGCLVTNAFDGHYISQQVLKLTTATEKFSHWQWVRLWADGPRTKEEEEETGMSVRVSIEVSEDGTNWVKGKSDLSLEDFENSSVDFSYYEGAYEEDEFNYHADVDQDIQSKRVLKDDFSVAGTTNQTDNVVVSTNGAYNNILVKATAEQGVLMHKVGPYDFSDCDQLELLLSTDRYIGDMEIDIVLLSDATFPEGLQSINEDAVLERHHLLYTQDTENATEIRDIITLDDPEKLEDVQAIAFVINYDPEVEFNFRLHELTGLQTVEYPFYERYLRLVICMSRPIEGINSPSVRQVGVIPMFD